MKRLVFMLALAGLMAGPAVADIVDSAPLGGSAGHVAIGAAGPRGDVVYSNITNGPTAGYGRLNPPAEEIGDDLLMTAGGLLDSVDFSVYNSSTSAGPLATADLLVKLYNWDNGLGNYVLAGSLSWDNVGFTGMNPGYYTTFSVTGIYDPLNPITLTNDILATLTISDLTGGATRVGQVLMDPPTVGSSQNMFYRNGSWYAFTGGVPVANFYWQIDVVPEPGTLGLLALGVLGLLRRR